MDQTPEQVLAKSLVAENKLNKLIDEVKEKNNLSADQIIIGGFSQGCMITLQTGLKRKDKINSVIGYSGRIIDTEHLSKNINSRPNIILMHGDTDQVVSIDSFLEAKEFFGKNNYEIETKIFKNCEHRIPTEKRIYNLKDFVVYPKHGVGKISAIEKAKIGEIDIQFYKILVEKEKLTLTVPINQQSKLRPISSINQINKCISILKTKPKIKRTMWSRRAQEYDQKINSGKIYELAEVVKDLNKNTDIIADQSYSERQLFEKAYERLKSEFEAVLKTSPEEVQKKMDKALGRTNISESTE